MATNQDSANEKINCTIEHCKSEFISAMNEYNDKVSADVALEVARFNAWMEEYEKKNIGVKVNISVENRRVDFILVFDAQQVKLPIPFPFERLG